MKFISIAVIIFFFGMFLFQIWLFYKSARFFKIDKINYINTTLIYFSSGLISSLLVICLDFQLIFQIIFFVFMSFFLLSKYLKADFKKSFFTLTSFLLINLILFFGITNIIRSYKIPSSAMEPTLHGDIKKGDRVLANMLLYYFQKPQRGDIILMKTDGIEGLSDDKVYVKRLVGLPGEKIYIKENFLFIDDKNIEDPIFFKNYKYICNESMTYGNPDKPVTVPEGFYYVLGDNTKNSKDSRYFGFVPLKNIIGKAVYIWFPFDRANKL
jgi:signal peptidase I